MSWGSQNKLTESDCLQEADERPAPGRFNLLHQLFVRQAGVTDLSVHQAPDVHPRLARTESGFAIGLTRNDLHEHWSFTRPRPAQGLSRQVRSADYHEDHSGSGSSCQKTGGAKVQADASRGPLGILPSCFDPQKPCLTTCAGKLTGLLWRRGKDKASHSLVYSQEERFLSSISFLFGYPLVNKMYAFRCWRKVRM